MKKIHVKRSSTFVCNLNKVGRRIWYCNNALNSYIMDWFTNAFTIIVSHKTKKLT